MGLQPAELLGGLALIAGLFTRLAALGHAASAVLRYPVGTARLIVPYALGG